MDPSRRARSWAMSSVTRRGALYLHASKALASLESRAAGDVSTRGSVSCLQFSNRALDGSMLVVGSEGGELTLLDTRGSLPRDRMWSAQLHSNLIADAALSADDTLLVSAGSDGVCKFVDVAAGRVTAVFDCSSTLGPLRHVRLSDPHVSGGPNVVFAAGRGPGAAIFDARASKRPIAYIADPARPPQQECDVSCAEPVAAKEAPGLSADDALPGITPPSGLLCLLCVAARRPSGPGGDRIGGLAVVDHYLVTGGTVSGDVQVWDVRRLPRFSGTEGGGSAAAQLPCTHTPAAIASRLLHPRRRDGAALVSATAVPTPSAAGGKRPRTAPPAPLHLLSQSSDTGRARAVQDLDVSADGTALLVSHAGGRLLVYDLARVLCGAGPAAANDGSQLRQQQGPLAAGCVAAIPVAAHAWGDGARALTGASPDRPQISAYAESAFRYDSLAGHARSTGRCRARFSRCGRFVLSGSGDGMAYVWELPRRSHERWRGCISGVDIDPQWILSGDGVNDSPCEVAWGGAVPGGDVSCATRLAVGGNDGIVRVWRPSAPQRESGGRCSVGAIDRVDTERSRRAGRRIAHDGEELHRAVSYADQPIRHRPQGGLRSRIVASIARDSPASEEVAVSASPAAPIAGQARWSIRSEIAPRLSVNLPPDAAAAVSACHDDDATRVREPPALVRQSSALLCGLRDPPSQQSDAATCVASPTGRPQRVATPSEELLQVEGAISRIAP